MLHLDVVVNATLVLPITFHVYMPSKVAHDESLVIHMNPLGKGRLAPHVQLGGATTILCIHLLAPRLDSEISQLMVSRLVSFVRLEIHLVLTNVLDVLLLISMDFAYHVPCMALKSPRMLHLVNVKCPRHQTKYHVPQLALSNQIPLCSVLL